MSLDKTALEQAVRMAAGARLQTARVDGETASVILEVSGLDRAARDALEAKVKDAARAAGAAEVRVGMTADRVTRRIIAVGSGKGGVGKSTLSANLAVAMARLGRKVGLVDADIYGPSQPRLLATEGRKPEAENQKIHPVPSPWGVPMLSMGHLVQPGQAIAWRGPMAGNALGQLIDAHWGDAEILVVDLPPGTGDVQLTMLQKHKPAGAVIVSTPQDLALMDAARAIRLFEQGDVPLIGMVENMAGYICPHCGESSDPFGAGGAEAAAMTMGLPFLGRVPLDLKIRQDSDAGSPPAAGDGPQAEIFATLASQVLAWLDAQD
ncbi:chromosome partitioning protein ParA [Novosphingobium fuchskuhlense]|uniref:Iron-sulfur cluster carrier protein n=2 Tax=Novosphingobium fuchskuhlense TaxID=1117702 RepID=A0A124JVM0_9SPHN|nr:chromosome partitioning protein ParA [Novosphingobium fuchskuhlense]